MESSKILNLGFVLFTTLEGREVFAAALKGIKTRKINVLLSTSPIFSSTGEIKSMPASSKEKIVKKKMEDWY